MKRTCPACGTVLSSGTLTPSQIRVLQMFASADVTLEEAAELLGMEPKTVKVHLGAIYRKLRVRSRTGMVAVAYQRGLVEVPDAEEAPSTP